MTLNESNGVRCSVFGVRCWLRSAVSAEHRTPNTALLLVCLALAACSAQQHPSPVPAASPVRVLPVKNLSGVTLRVPELWLGDAGDRAAELDVELIDLRLLAEAGIRARLALIGRETGASRFELHAAISRFDMDELRTSGRITLGLAVVLVDAEQRRVLAESEIVQDFQLMDRGPAETGMLGEQRFIRRRLELFSEELAKAALQELGL